MQQRLDHIDDLASSFNRLVERDANLSHELARAERDLQQPCRIEALLRRHPWLGETIHGELSVLRLLQGVRWQSATTDPKNQWIFGADIRDCERGTLRAINLGAGEVMSLETAARLLDAQRIPFPKDRNDLGEWLAHCGFECTRSQVTASIPPKETAPTPLQEGRGTLLHLMERIADLLQVNQNLPTPVTLGDILSTADRFAGELGEVSRQLRGATLTSDGRWLISSEAAAHTAHGQAGTENTAPPSVATAKMDSENFTLRSGASVSTESGTSKVAAEPAITTTDTPSESSFSSFQLAPADVDATPPPGDRIAELLDGAPTGLSSSAIKAALGPSVSEEQAVRSLFGDERFAITSGGNWVLKDRFIAEERSSSDWELNHPHITPINDDPVWVPMPRDGDGNGMAATEVGAGDVPKCEPDRMDKIESALRDTDQPMTVDELKRATGISLGSQYLKQQIEEDPRFSRSQKHQWALAEWGLPVYKPIKELISDMVDAHDGAVAADEVVRTLCRDFEIKESSVRQAMSSPPFTARGGIVRRLGEDPAETRAFLPAEGHSAAEFPRSTAMASPDVEDLMGKLGLI
ncbi:hypothetical protein [Streptomyces sp. UH6]|uniref:hypothetical protein n=1 Tax=Streptomyces sp. UH6 TaxID=2748379 RepID=UPI0015D4A3A4|nr:hypothetical protein [Streptomyces sp. UH6]NYV73202.1 hypothetical protein [Streptomyces sp. UH6]